MAALLLTACAGEPSQQPVDAGSGPNPVLPPPESKALPLVNIAPATGWSGDQKPSAAAGMAVASYAADLDHPRWLYVLPNGDVLVAETNAPERPEDKQGIKGYFMNRAQKSAGAGVPSARRSERNRLRYCAGVSPTLRRNKRPKKLASS